MKKSVQWNKLNSLSKGVYISEQVCTGWRRAVASYTAKLTFSHGSIKVRGAYYASVCIIFEILRYFIQVQFVVYRVGVYKARGK